MTVLSLGIISSIEISNSSYPMAVLLSSPYLSMIIESSSLITIRSFLLSARIAFNSSIRFINSLYSASIFSLSRPVRVLRRISTIACDCASESPNLSINFCFATLTLSEPLIIDITSSILSRAISRPSKI